ncbi:MAG: hypothetical protein PW792_08290 [Acidobacteriaceae bacterium]|nr:hypothetical protein [Acidobacteriaceae bacterium]
MKKAIFTIFFGIWPLFLGVFLPYVSFFGGLRLLNILWSIANGLGLWVIDASVGLSVQSKATVIGAFLWPIAVSAAMAFWGSRLFDMSSKTRIVAVSLLLASSLFTVSLGSAQHAPAVKYPTYYRLFFAVW